MVLRKLFRAVFVFSFFTLCRADIVMDEECLNYTVYPVNYELNIYPYVYAERSYFDCDLTITIIANAPNVIVIDLDARDLEIEGGSIKVLDGNRDIVNGARPFEFDNFTSKLHIYLKEPLKVYSGSNKQFYHVKIMYRKYVKTDNTGVFLVKYYDEQNKGFKYLFATRLSPNKAKYFLPCFDNPRFEAVFKFKVYILKRLSDLQYTNTSLVIAEEQRRDNFKTEYVVVEYVPSPQVGLHQVGFHYSRFASLSGKAENTNDTFTVWAPIDELRDFNFIHNYGLKIINLIHEYAQSDRRLLQGSINVVAVPSVINGYEIGSFNLLTIGAHKIVSIDQFTSIKQTEAMMFDLAQQLSRIWLGNPAESERTRWKEEWFKEGMATYLAYYFLTQYNHGLPTEHNRPISSYGLQMKHKAMAIDWHRSTPALDTFNTSLAIEIPSRYRELVMMKTGAILWMLENWVQSSKFHQALVNYIKSRRGKYISLEDFTTNLDRKTIECLHQFFNGSTASRILGSWFRRRGYPVINVQVLRDRTPNAVLLKQRQFSFTHENRDDSDYLIPISYVIQHHQNCYNCYRPRFTIGAQTYTFSENLNDGWILLNRNASGYYRVNYDADTWRIIAKTLKENIGSIHEMNRAQIVNDVFALYVAGDLDFQLATEILDYLDLERSPVVWDSVISGFDLLTIEGAGCGMTKHVYWEWENFMMKKVSTIFQQLVQSKDSQVLTRLFRSAVVQLSCALGGGACAAHVRRLHVEHRRGRHALFPDCRLAYYFVLANETFSSTYSRKLNAIEQDDKTIADRKIRDKNRFMAKIPIGEPRPMPIVMSTTTIKPSEAVPEKLVPGSASATVYSVSVLFIIILINTFIR